MSGENHYWIRRTISRRAALRAAAAAGGGVAALSLIGCGSNSGGSSGAKEPAKPATEEKLDLSKGKPGGTLTMMQNTFPTSLTAVDTSGNVFPKMMSMVYSGLLGFRFGTPLVPGTDASVEPDLAQALPEQPDELTYTFKLRPGAKFHNGRAVTSEDVLYSYDRYANNERSLHKSAFLWLDKVQTPDAQTVVVKTKQPFADAMGSMAANTNAYILAKEHEESKDAPTKLMGSGPFIFVEAQPPVSSAYRKNPDYYNKPYPYFNEVKFFTLADAAKRVADFVARSVNVSYWNPEELRDEIKRGRPDAQVWGHDAPGYLIYVRLDKPPFNDQRLRQAVSMSLNRKAMIEGTTKGEGKPDTALSWTNAAWGFRKPADMGANAKYWEYNPAEAKKLIAAAGFDKPIETTYSHPDSSLGQQQLDQAVLAQANLRDVGILAKDNTQAGPQYLTSTAIGNYDGIGQGPGPMAPIVPIMIRNALYWPAGAARPPANNSYLNDPQLNTLLDKQNSQLKLDDRKQTLRQIDDLLAENQWRIGLVTNTQTWFADPFLKNILMPAWGPNSTHRFVMYWWSDKV